MQLTRQDRCDHLQIDLRSRLPDLGDDGGTVLREIVVQGQDEFLIELVAAADRPALGVAGLGGLPLWGRWVWAGHSRLSRSAIRDMGSNSRTKHERQGFGSAITLTVTR